MMRRTLVILVAMVLGGVAIGRAGNTVEGAAPFSFQAFVEDTVLVGKDVTIWISMYGRYRSTDRVRGEVFLPKGLRLVRGDIVRDVPGPGDALNWRITVRPERPGAFDIRGLMEAAVGGGVRDEAEFELRVETGQSNRRTSGEIVRQEVVRGDKRYRYAGLYLVPINEPERFREREWKHAKRAKTRDSMVVVVDSTSSAVDRSLIALVLVGPSGAVLETRVLGSKAIPIQLERRIVEALKSREYEPTVVAGRVINDYAEVRVKVKSAGL